MLILWSGNSRIKKRWLSSEQKLQQFSYDAQILSPRDFYELAEEGIHGVEYFYESQVDITKWKELEAYVSIYMQISDTGENNCYMSLNCKKWRFLVVWVYPLTCVIEDLLILPAVTLSCTAVLPTLWEVVNWHYDGKNGWKDTEECNQTGSW